jgi:hypothetical protein
MVVMAVLVQALFLLGRLQHPLAHQVVMVAVAVVALTLALRVAEVLEVVVEEVNTATILPL